MSRGDTAAAEDEGTGKVLWEVAIKEAEEKQDAGAEESTIVFCGAKSSGKTSVVLRFLDREEPPKATTALEYTFGRRSKGHNVAKDIGHIWELGGGPWLTKLLDIPITPETLLRSSVAVVVDLTDPACIWVTLEKLIDAVKKRVEATISEAKHSDPNIRDKLKRATWERIGVEHEDRDMMDPLLIPLLIIGTKYDQFQDMDPEARKVITKTLRFVAHTYGGSLVYFSSKIENLVAKTRTMVSSLVFGTPVSKSVHVDHMKPVLVAAGLDGLSMIGAPPIDDRDIGKGSMRAPVDLWKKAFTGRFPQKNTANPALVDDPAKDPQFAEHTIDTLRKQKDEELERYRRQCEKRARGQQHKTEGAAF